MFKWLKRLFHPTRLIERYEDLDAIIEAHNKLILRTNEVRDNMPPKYLLSRYNAIQSAEEKAIAAYWRNKDKKHDKWYRRSITPENNTMTDIVQEKPTIPPGDLAATQPEPPTAPPAELAATPTVEALPVTASDTQSLEEKPKENVIEIHINQ